MLKTSLYDVLDESARRIEAAGLSDGEDVLARKKPLVAYSPERAAQHKELGRFLYECYYRHPRVLRSAASAQQAIALIIEHYGKHTAELPRDYRDRIEADGIQRTLCDYVAGMTDRYALAVYEHLFMAKPWTVR
jgi:dGTPase